MFNYDRIYIFGGIGINKTNNSRNFSNCCYNYFFETNHSSQQCACKGCHEFFQIAMSFKEIAVLSVKEICFRINF